MLGSPILHPSTSLTSLLLNQLKQRRRPSIMEYSSRSTTLLVIQTVLRVSLDLRDLPGSASTLSILYATGKSRGSDAAAYVFNWCRFWLDVDLETAMWLTSTLSGTAMIVGIIATATSIWGTKTRCLGWHLGSLLVLSQQMGLLVGLDSLAIGSTWLD